jgi:hypothetical protein
LYSFVGKLSFQNPVTATFEEVEELRPERKAASDEQREELEARSKEGKSAE